jgi:hypothetical protein
MPKAKRADGEKRREPSGVWQIPQNFSHGFTAKLHRAIGHEDVDGCVGIPNIELRIERPKLFGIIADRPFDDAGFARFAP